MTFNSLFISAERSFLAAMLIPLLVAISCDDGGKSNDSARAIPQGQEKKDDPSENETGDWDGAEFPVDRNFTWDSGEQATGDIISLILSRSGHFTRLRCYGCDCSERIAQTGTYRLTQSPSGKKYISTFNNFNEKGESVDEDKTGVCRFVFIDKDQTGNNFVGEDITVKSSTKLQ